MSGPGYVPWKAPYVSASRDTVPDHRCRVPETRDENAGTVLSDNDSARITKISGLGIVQD